MLLPHILADVAKLQACYYGRRFWKNCLSMSAAATRLLSATGFLA